MPKEQQVSTDRTVFIVDDDAALLKSMSRSLVRYLLKTRAFSSVESFLLAIETRKPGCIVLDYDLPGMNGLELQAHLKANNIRTPIIFITGHGGIQEAVAATKAGAVNFLEKPYEPLALVDSIEEALQMNTLNQQAGAAMDRLDPLIGRLTTRERQIFDLMIRKPDASSSKGVAQLLNISPRTVEKHRAQIMYKTGCRTTTELVARYSK